LAFLLHKTNSSRVVFPVAFNITIYKSTTTTSLAWQFPAGMLKSGVSENDIIVNEILEETGIVCKPVRRIGRRMHPDTNVICNYWIVNYVSGEPLNGDPKENQEVAWIDIGEYHNMISTDIFQPIISYLEGEK